MKEIKLIGLDQNLLYEKLSNGLDVYLLPYSNKNTYTMQYITKFGSINTTFIPYGKKNKITVPDGIAHFLEHKMFEQEDGVDPFTFASKTGTYSNACTDYDCTRYYFEGNKAFKENLDYLLDFIGSPYFTDENVEKEKGIIAEEIKQYDDEVEWAFEEEMNKALLKKDNHRVDIAGTVETINKITKEVLYETYETYYQPSNMIMFISGNFDVDEAMKTIRNNKILNKAKTNYKIKDYFEKEPVEVNKKRVDIKFNVINTKVGYGIKIPLKNVDDVYLFGLYIGLMLNTKFGLSSNFREMLKKEELMTSFYVDRATIKDYLIISFKADSKNPDALIKKIQEELEKDDITDADIERIKKVWISSEVMMIDNSSMSLDNILSDIIEYGKVIPNKIELYRSLNKDKLISILQQIDLTNSSILTIKPKK